MAAVRRTSRRTARRTTKRTSRKRSTKRVSRRRAKRRVTRRKAKRRVKRRVVRRRRKARKNIRGSKVQVAHGTRTKTNGGLTKDDIIQNKRGRFVSKKANAHGKRVYKRNLVSWNKAFMKARKTLNIEGFVPCKKGTKLYNTTMSFYKN